MKVAIQGELGSFSHEAAEKMLARCTVVPCARSAEVFDRLQREAVDAAVIPVVNQPELAMPGLQEELKKKINRPVPELAIAEDTDVLEAQSDQPGNGNGHHSTKPAAPERTVKTLSDSVAHFQQDAPTCPSCGHVTVRNGACYKCLNCGESLGCS